MKALSPNFILFCVAMPAFAADCGAEAPLEEIIVTANRRETNLQDTAVAVSAFSREIWWVSNVCVRPPDTRSSMLAGAARTLDKRMRLNGKRLFIGGEKSVRRTLLIRTAAVVAMLMIVIAVFCWDRGGLRDNHDEQLSFARVEEAENEKLLKQSGADATVMPSRVGGILMADSLDSSTLISYVMDLISADGEIMLIERAALPHEVGRSPLEIREVLILRVLRKGEALGCGKPALRIEAGDQLIIVAPVTDG